MFDRNLRYICDGCEYNVIYNADELKPPDYTCDACGYKGYVPEFDDVETLVNSQQATYSFQWGIEWKNLI